MRYQGQTSVELLIVLALSLVILGILVNFTTHSLQVIQKDHSIRVTQENISTLTQAVNQTYHGGPGTVQYITLTWPQGLDSNMATLQNHAISVSLYDINVTGEVTPLVQGSLSTAPGSRRVKLSANDTTVTIGTLSLSANVSSIYLPLAQDSNGSSHVIITNFSGESVSATTSTAWTHTPVSISVNPSAGTISAGGNWAFDLNASATSSAVGNYAGYITVNAPFSSGTETLSIPVNVEVYPTADSLLSVFPNPLSLNAFSNDTNTSTLQVCNNGNTEIKTVSFTPTSGGAGDWVQGISTLATIPADDCTSVDFTVSVPNGTDPESYSGVLLVSDYTGANTQVVPFTVHVLGMNDLFEWDWDPATFNAQSITGFHLLNAGSKALRVSEVTLQKWWSCDSSHADLNTIRVDGNLVFSGNVSDGNSTNVTDFNVNAGATLTNNTLTFSNTINDENEQFQAVVGFFDGTEYVSPVHGEGCVFDTVAPSHVSDLTANPGPIPKSVKLQFTFPGDDNASGTPTTAIFKYAMTPDANTPSVWANSVEIPFSQDMNTGGSAGSLLLTDLNVGVNYFFTVIFYDEADNNSGLSNVAVGRPWNRFDYSNGDFNIANFAHSLTTSPPSNTPGDVNQFMLSDFSVTGEVDKNMVLRVKDDSNTANTWYIALDIQDTTLTRIRVWYPLASQEGVPSARATYTKTTSQSISSGINLLDSTLVNSEYRYGGSSVPLPRPNNLYINYLVGINDFNLAFDLNETQYS